MALVLLKSVHYINSFIQIYWFYSLKFCNDQRSLKLQFLHTDLFAIKPISSNLSVTFKERLLEIHMKYKQILG